MKDKHPTGAAALLLIFGAGAISPLHAEPVTAPTPMSENCQRAAEGSGSFLLSVPKVLCQEEEQSAQVFGTLLSVTDNLTHRNLTGSEEEAPPKTRPTTERHPTTKPRSPVGSKRSDLHVRDNKDFATYDKPHSTKAGAGRPRADGRRQVKPPTEAQIREDFYIERRLRELSYEERKDLVRKYERLLRQGVVIVFLNTVEKGEGGALLMIVGGTLSKSPKCQRLIRQLDVSGHPKAQGLPDKCFLTTRKYGLSTAAGKYQIVYYKNWRHLQRLLGLKDFSARSQAIAALELVRTSKVKKGKLGEGLIALVRGDLKRAIRKGTDPWASSPYSRWAGKYTAPLLQYAQQERKKMENEKYASRQFRTFRRGNNS